MPAMTETMFHVKHDSGTDRNRQLLSGARELGIEMEPSQARAMLRHLEWLLLTNETMNLTSVAAEDAIRLHLLDSLSALSDLATAPAGPVLDLGTGGGLPGIPLAIATGREFVLLDSVKKKAAALRQYVESEGLSARVEDRRAEEYAEGHAGDFACVVARAVSSLPSLVELASPLLQHDGVLLCLKGRLDEAERERGLRAADQCGLSEYSMRHLRLPGGEESRTIVGYRKTGASMVALPRRVGLAQKRPLA